MLHIHTVDTTEIIVNTNYVILQKYPWNVMFL